MNKKILVLPFLILTLLSTILTSQSGSKTSETLRKFGKNPDQLRLLNRIEKQRKEKEEFLERMKRKLRSKAESSNVELVGKWPYGPCKASDLDTTRNIAVIGNGETLQVLDISNPFSPLKVGEVILHEEPLKIVIAENYAYVSSGDSLRVIDISMLSSPNEVGNVDISGRVTAIAVQYPYVYAAGYNGLIIFDVSIPSDPTQVGFYKPEYSGVDDVAIWQNYAFIINTNYYDAGRVEELVIIDVSNPSTPALTGSCQLGADLSSVRIYASDTGYAYISQYNYREQTSQLKIVDVATDPSQPAEVGNYTELDISFYDLVVSGNYAYIFARRGYQIPWILKGIDISNPEIPFSIGEWELASNCSLYGALDIVISGSTIGIPHLGDGFGLYDVSDPSNLFHSGSYDTPSSVLSLGISSIVVSGDYAYMANKYDGLRIMDISIPSNPSEVGICDSVYGTSVAVSGNYAYGVGAQVFWVVDISLPFTPIQVGHLDYSDSNWWFQWDVCVSGNYAYVCGTQYVSDEYRASLEVINVSDPSDLKIIGSYICSNESYNWGGIALSGNHVYLPFNDDTGTGFKIIDISDPTNPVELGIYVSDDYSSYDVEVRGNYAYLTGDDLTIIDVTNPSSPSEISSYPIRSYGIALSGNYAYLGYFGLELIDISDPYDPVEAGYYYNSPNLESAVAIYGNYAYVPGSLYILRNILAPEVSITSPSTWSEVSGSISIEAQASHGSGIAQVEFYIDDSFQEADTSSPYTCDWDTTSTEEGSHKIKARAYNNNGKSSDAEIEVTIRNNMKLTISSGVGGTTDPEPGTYTHLFGSNVSITANPESGYLFSGWVGDVPEGHEEDNPLTLTMDSDKSITANFVRQYTLTIIAEEGGTTDPAPDTYTYDSGARVSITAIPGDGYRFSGWTEDVPSGHESDNPLTVTMDSDKSVTAHFIRQYTLTIAADTGGTTNPSPGSYVHDSGASVSVTAIADSGWNFSEWGGDASGTTETITITMDSDKSITASFIEKPPPPVPDDDDQGGGCFIATAAYGSPLHPHIDILRQFRDKYLMTNTLGRKFVAMYYKYSPSMAERIAKYKILKVFIRIQLLPLVALGYSTVYLGPIMTAFVFAFIFMLPIFLFPYSRKKYRGTKT